MSAAASAAGVSAGALRSGAHRPLTLRVFVLTGAGLSAESGIPTFRDAQTGLWARYDPMQLATPEAFAADPALVHRFYTDRRAAAHAARPNAGHVALARLQRGLGVRGGLATLCTQNVDDLLERAGADPVLHMHGSLLDGRCLACGTTSHWAGAMDLDSACPACGTGGRMRPGIVWFGEMPLHLGEIERAIGEASLFVAIGTSGAVYPAAGFVDLARAAGVATMEINVAATDRSGAFDVVVEGKASEAVPRWVEAALRGAGTT